jgi:integrase
MKKRITEAVAAELKATQSDKDLFVFDSLLSGYALRRTPDPSARIIHLGIARVDGHKWRDTVAYWPDVSTAEGRELVRLAIGDRRAGRDPRLERQARQQAAAAGRATIAELAEQWLDAYVRPKLKATSTALDYERHLRRHILPVLGHLTIAGIAQGDVNGLHVKMKPIPRTANYAVGDVLGGLLEYAIGLGLRADNPCRKIRRYPERAHERFLSEREQALAIEAVDEGARENAISEHAAGGIKLALLTGARKSELAAARWRDVDWDRRFIRLSTSKSGAPRTIFLSEAAIAVLRAIPRVGPYIIAGGRNGPFRGLSQSWIRVRGLRSLDDVRFHDLRHSYASAALKAGIPLATVGKLLGHKRAATTERYAHLAADHLAAAGDIVGATIAAAIEKAAAPSADVVKLPRRRRRQ